MPQFVPQFALEDLAERIARQLVPDVKPLQIAELLTRYLRSVDRGDVATLRACYLPGATEDHGGLFAGPAPVYAPRLTPGHAPTPFGIMIA